MLEADRTRTTDHHEHFDVELARRIVEEGLGVAGNVLLAAVGTTTVSLTPGRLEVVGKVTDSVLNPFDVAHGGVAAMLVDHCTGVVAWPLAPPGWWPATTHVSIDYLRPLRAGPVRAVAQVREARSARLLVDVEVTSADRPVAIGRGNVVITKPATGGQSPSMR